MGEAERCADDPRRVAPKDLRWCCGEEQLDFRTTAEVEPIQGVVGQDDAVEALRFGLEIHAPGQNVFVRGLVGTGRLTLVRGLLEEIQPDCPRSDDLAYVHDFEAPDRPRLLRLPRGRGQEFRERLDELARFVRERLEPALASEELQARQRRLEEQLGAELKAIGDPFDRELAEAGLGLVPVRVGDETRPMVLPLVDGQPVTSEGLAALVAERKLSEGEAEALAKRVQAFAPRFGAFAGRMGAVQRRQRQRVRELYAAEVRRLLEFEVQAVLTEFPSAAVRDFLTQVVDDVVRSHFEAGEGGDSTQRYRVNLVLAHRPGAHCPIVIEHSPSLSNLLGTIERRGLAEDGSGPDHMAIRCGSLLRAHGGYLVLEARDVLEEPATWKALMRTLRTGRLEISPSESPLLGLSTPLKPEPVDLRVKVVMLGDPDLYWMLDELDPDFSDLFKVLADFDSTVSRDAVGLGYYAGVLARIARDENLVPFGRDAVAALAEHGARIADRRGRLSARFGRLADIAREASFVVRKAERRVVTRADIEETVRRTRYRSDLPARKFRELVREGTVRIETRGTQVGQINGLTVLSSGPLTYGFPTRITATIGAGTAGAIHIEREARLSGAIHTKGFYILGGLLRHLLRTEHPLTFSASIAFEQSYGGIDGDSASAAEMCCLLSALTGVPLRQDLALTGAIDQLGHVQAVGAASEKIEGFYDTCLDAGLAGTQGVIVPAANVPDLMLRADVVEAVRRGTFHVYAAETIHDALELLSGRAAGARAPGESHPPGSLLALAVERARVFWRMVAQSTPAPPAAGGAD